MPENTELVIPEGIRVIAPSVLNSWAVASNKTQFDGLVSVTFPDSVEVIGTEAFHFCSNCKFQNLPANLKTLGVWLSAAPTLTDGDWELAYESSGCLQCGCCLEVCPNFYADGPFFGMATVPLTARLLTELSPAEYRAFARQYAKHTFAGCGKSLACKDVCPRHIDTENLLVNANALAIWKRKKRNRK